MICPEASPLSIDPTNGPLSNAHVLEKILEFVSHKGLELYPAQEESILELLEGKNVILNTPTGSGKSLVALALHFHSLAQGRRSVYTSPIKALVNEKWRALCRDFGPSNVGLSTGDASVNIGAPILCCTAEILANLALRSGGSSAFSDVVMDEFHYYSDKQRGVAWQIPLLTMENARFLLMSATLGDTSFFVDSLTQLNGKPTRVVGSTARPVPLEFDYSEVPLTSSLQNLVEGERTPVYVVHFTQSEATENAQNFTSINVCSKADKERLSELIAEFKFNTPFGPSLKRWLRHGIGVHHAGMLPKYRMLVEKLAQAGLLKVICGTDTLGVGINVPIKTVVFTRLCKFDGEKVSILKARDFHQIAGRAGRKGFDDVGYVIAQAPEHVIENIRLDEKASKSGKKVTKQKPPEKNFVSWDKLTFARLINATPERMTSQFSVSHGMLLNVLARPKGGCEAFRCLITRCHDAPKQKKAHFRRAWQLFRALYERNIVSFQKDISGTHVQVRKDLQSDFSMSQTLSLYLIETVELLNSESPNYALDLLSLVESILEDPDTILYRQLDRARSQKLAELRSRGVDFMQAQAELDLVEYPKPNREFIYSTFNSFASRHPWIDNNNVKPKSIAREMFESFQSFRDYIHSYELQRAEGALLRHLSSTLKVLDQTVPIAFRTDSVKEMMEFLETELSVTDSSLIEEWRSLSTPSANGSVTLTSQSKPPPPAQSHTISPSRTIELQLNFIRNRIFRFLKLLSVKNFDEALEIVPFTTDVELSSTPQLYLQSKMDQYFSSHGRLGFDPEARNKKHTYILPQSSSDTFKVYQTLVDDEQLNDWCLELRIKVLKGLPNPELCLELCRLGPILEKDAD